MLIAQTCLLFDLNAARCIFPFPIICRLRHLTWIKIVIYAAWYTFCIWKTIHALSLHPELSETRLTASSLMRDNAEGGSSLSKPSWVRRNTLHAIQFVIAMEGEVKDSRSTAGKVDDMTATTASMLIPTVALYITSVLIYE